jgi:U3 small nucleolar RNA-associated protein 12
LELERLYEAGIAENLNNAASEQADLVVSKQTKQTLMAGERIIEALQLADEERAKFSEYNAAIARLTTDDTIQLEPPPRNPILAAYDMEPEMYVLRIIERIPSTALQDALLVLPFTMVISLMEYLNIWAQKVNGSLVIGSRLTGIRNGVSS